MTPEFMARQEIDRLLSAAGWHVCDRTQAYIHAALEAMPAQDVVLTT
jgi:hypothetical protein